MQTNINLEVIKLCKNKTIHASLNIAFIPTLLEPRFGFTHRPPVLEQEALFHLPRCTTPEAAPPRRLPKVLWANQVDTFSTTGSSGASSLSSSHSSNIIILWWTDAASQQCQHDILKQENIKNFKYYILTVKDTNTCTRDMTTRFC